MMLFKHGAIIGCTVSIIQTNINDRFCRVELQIDRALVNLAALNKRVKAFTGLLLEYPAEMVF